MQHHQAVLSAVIPEQNPHQAQFSVEGFFTVINLLNTRIVAPFFKKKGTNNLDKSYLIIFGTIATKTGLKNIITNVSLFMRKC